MECARAHAFGPLRLELIRFRDPLVNSFGGTHFANMLERRFEVRLRWRDAALPRSMP